MTITNRFLTGILASLLMLIFMAPALALDPGPPPDRPEVPPKTKRHGYVWSPGYWQWHRHQYVWVSGHWLRERPGYRYHSPRWVYRQGHWRHEHGRWSRAVDSDGDGVPNRRDRRPYDRYRY